MFKEQEKYLDSLPQKSLHNPESPVDVDDECHKDLDQTFFVEDSIRIVEQCMCEHTYETGIVVVAVSNQFLSLLVQCRGAWLTTEVDPLKVMMVVDGIRIKEVFSVNIGTIGHMVTKECTKCMSSTNDTVTPVLVWFGETQVPSVRGLPGLVVGRENAAGAVRGIGPFPRGQ